MAQARRRWIREQGFFDPARLVFVDETATNMARLRGRRARGVRLIGHVPQSHWKTLTFVAGLRQDGMVAPFVIEGPIDGANFLAYAEQCLVPALKPGDIVVMDHLKAHLVAGVREAIEAAGATATLTGCPIRGDSRRDQYHGRQWRSKWPLPSSKPFCAKPPNEPFAVSGDGSLPSSPKSPHKNAPTISLTLDMLRMAIVARLLRREPLELGGAGDECLDCQADRVARACARGRGYSPERTEGDGRFGCAPWKGGAFQWV